MKKCKLVILFIFMVSMAAGSSSLSGEDAPCTMGRVHDPIQVPGDLLHEFNGASLDSLGLYAYRDGKMTPMIYQIDERTPDGNFIMDLGDGKNPELHNNILDPQDFLMFRLGDAGGQAPRSAWLSPDGVEIELQDPVKHGVSYAYLLKFTDQKPERDEEDTVVLEHWDPWERPDWPFIVRGTTYRIEGLVNHINDKYYKTAVNKNFRTPKSAGGQDVNILDGMRMRAFCELKWGVYRIESDETKMIGGIDSLRHSHIRGYGRQWMTQTLPFGIEGPRIYSDVFTYDRIIVSPMQLNIPMNPDMIINLAGIEFGYDLNNAAKGMRFYSPNCMDGVTIDGQMSEREKQIPNDWVPWYLITGPQGSLIFRVDIQKDFLEQTSNKLTYIDDVNQAFPPEDVPGSIGYARTTIEMKSVTPGHYGFQIEWYFPPNFYKDGGYDKQMLQEFLDIKDHPIVIKAGGKSVKNRALSPPPLLVVK